MALTKISHISPFPLSAQCSKTSAHTHAQIHRHNPFQLTWLLSTWRHMTKTVDWKMIPVSPIKCSILSPSTVFRALPPPGTSITASNRPKQDGWMCVRVCRLGFAHARYFIISRFVAVIIGHSQRECPHRKPSRPEQMINISFQAG